MAKENLAELIGRIPTTLEASLGCTRDQSTRFVAISYRDGDPVYTDGQTEGLCNAQAWQTFSSHATIAPKLPDEAYVGAIMLLDRRARLAWLVDERTADHLIARQTPDFIHLGSGFGLDPTDTEALDRWFDPEAFMSIESPTIDMDLRSQMKDVGRMQDWLDSGLARYEGFDIPTLTGLD